MRNEVKEQRGVPMRVLLVDDQVWLRSALRFLLEQEPNLQIVGEEGSLTALLGAVQRLHPDLVLLDWEMTGLKSGDARKQLLADVRAAAPQVYIIALCGGETTHRQRRMNGADAFVSKAEPPEHLLAAVQQAALLHGVEGTGLHH
jgi:DNA-binding NarL/FixJ family response regulator